MSGRLLVVTPLKFEMNAICGYLQRKGVQGSVMPFAGTLASSLDNLGRAVWEWRQN